MSETRKNMKLIEKHEPCFFQDITDLCVTLGKGDKVSTIS